MKYIQHFGVEVAMYSKQYINLVHLFRGRIVCSVLRRGREFCVQILCEQRLTAHCIPLINRVVTVTHQVLGNLYTIAQKH